MPRSLTSINKKRRTYLYNKKSKHTEKTKDKQAEQTGRTEEALSVRSDSPAFINVSITNVSKSKARVPKNTNFSVLEFYLGPMDVKCKMCNSLNFKSELGNDKAGTYCCHKGKIKLERHPYPELLKKVLTNTDTVSNNFKTNVRSYNSSLAFASLGAQLAPVSVKGPYCFKIHGQVYHITSKSLYPEPSSQPKYAQLYILDVGDAVTERMKNSSNCNCLISTMTTLSEFFLQHNVLAKSYKMIHEVEKQYISTGNPVIPLTLIFKTLPGSDQRRYSVPASNEIAFVFEGDDGAPPLNRDIKVYCKSTNETQQISMLDPKLEAFVYPILVPYGSDSWHPGLQSLTSNKKVTQMQYYGYHLAVRDDFNQYLSAGKLTQQFIVDAYLKTEGNRLNYLRLNQRKLRVESYSGLQDHLQNDDADAPSKVGKRVILPSTFQGCPRNMQQNYQDAMSIVRRYGKPDIFLTITCNPNWAEISENLNGESPESRPDLIAKVFNLKLSELLRDIVKDSVFGNVIAYMYTIEFQKRGLPHAHMLFILDPQNKLNGQEEIDQLVWAEIPDKEKYPDLHNIVIKNMIHGPCGILNPKSPCMVDGKCSKDFPKNYANNTIVTSGYPVYQRREQGSVVYNNKVIDNKWVVPYNPYLLQKFNCHMNVEICSSVKSIKYIYKYIYKGYDSANIEINGEQDRDEIKQFIDSRYISAPEAMWRLNGYKMHNHSHSIIRLAVHLPDMQSVYFQEGEENQALDRCKNTTLTAWFELNQSQISARQYLYSDIPYHYVFSPNKTWQPRKKHIQLISRMYTVAPGDNERYFLRLLLLHVKGAQSFVDLRTFDGTVYESFKEAAISRNLILNDQEWDSALSQSEFTDMPSQMRMLFVFICVFGNATNMQSLWEKYKDGLSEDYFRAGASNYYLKGLQEIQAHSLTYGKKCSDFNIDDPPGDTLDLNNCNITTIPGQEWDTLFAKLNKEQQNVFNAVVRSINNETREHLFFVDGPGGTGKTFLYNALVSYCIQNRKHVIPVASTGIAATLLNGGTTYHSKFKLPIPLNESSVSNIKLQSIQAKQIKESSIIIWDEVSMTPRYALAAVDRLLKDICDNNVSFGGKTVLFGGDFRQILPVVHRGGKIEILETCVKSSPLWKHVKSFFLTENMRTPEKDFAQWLLDIGEGKHLNNNGLESDLVEIPKEIITTNCLVSDIFGTSFSPTEVRSFGERIILCPRNEDTYEINSQVLSRLEGQEKVYYSIDSIECDDQSEVGDFPTEFLNSLTPSGMPLYELRLKVGAIIMLLRNMNTKAGLCNGTRLIVNEMKDNVLVAEIITGSHKGNVILIPRIDLAPSDPNLPFVLRRRQFPIRVTFAMTVNKAQGQSFQFCGLYLSQPVFTHGQLYVALSRAVSKARIKIKIVNSNEQGSLLRNCDTVFAKNVVYSEIFNMYE